MSEEGAWWMGNFKFSLCRVLLSLSFAVFIYCIYGVSATWISLGYNQWGDHVTQTTTPPLSFYNSLTRSLFLFFPPCKTYSTLSLSLPPSLACPPPLIPLPLVSLFSHFLSHLLPNSLSSDLASLWPTPSIPSLQPTSLPPQLSTAWVLPKNTSELSHVRHKGETRGEKKKKNKHLKDPHRRECAIFNLLSAATSLLLSFNELKSKCLDQHVWMCASQCQHSRGWVQCYCGDIVTLACLSCCLSEPILQYVRWVCGRPR